MSKLRKETKSKFDALLKAALEKKSKSRQNLVSESSESDKEAYNNEVIEVDVYDDLNVENKSYIMDKFLNNSQQESDVDKPVPKPRTVTGIIKSVSSNSGTYLKGKDSVGSNSISEIENADITPIKPQPLPRKRTKLPSKQTTPINSDQSPDISIANKSDSDEKEKASITSKTNIYPDDDSIQSKHDKASELNEILDDNQNDDIEMQEMSLPEVHYESEKKKKSAKKTEVIKEYDYGKIISLMVHCTDRLLLDSYVVHPVVKIHIVDGETGCYLKKSDKSRNVLFFDDGAAQIDYIGPIMTQSYNLQKHRSFYPNWEESIYINEDANYITDNHSVIIFFEIIDFLSISIINQSNDSPGWHKIAWAFLKLSSPQFTNTDRKLRLQLFYPNKTKKNYPPNAPPIYNCWRKRRFKKYPSTIYVTIKSIRSPDSVIATMRSKTPHEIERGPPIEQKDKIDQNKDESKPDLDARISWSRVENQICKIPNHCAEKIDSYDEGCLVLKFSNHGKYLACAIRIDNVYTIIIYSMLHEDEDVKQLSGHQGLIYSLNWSKDDRFLVSASADCTVSVWDMETFRFIEMLPHPSFVYSSDVHENIIATGCYDNIIRIWQFEETSYELTEELKDHRGYITSICFNKNGNMLYSSDSVGVVIVWKIANNEWKIKKEIQILDLKKTVINQILLHKRERRLLINSRDSKLRLVDIKTGYVLQTFQEALNNKVQLLGCFSPCGNFVLCGSEIGELYFWNTDTGKIQHVFSPYNMKIPIHCIQYHPKDNYMAISHYGMSLPILLYNYVKDCDEVDNVNVSLVKHKETVNKNVSQNLRPKYEGGLDFRSILEKMDHIISPR